MFEIEGNSFRVMKDSNKFIKGDILTINEIRVYNGSITNKIRVHFECKNQYKIDIIVNEEDFQFLQLITI